jgi:predicted enzyme related to lactoylglutathione lyase
MPTPELYIHYLEIVTQDAEGARDFYSQLYGWSFSKQSPELGNAFTAEIAGGSVCGICAPMHETEAPKVRTYFRVADINASAKKAAELGATVALEPTPIPGRGTIAIYIHGGIEQGIWQTP